MTIKPIETRWNGYRFRSRLEARWAVFFDALGLSWEYEPEGFDLGEAGYYLPDFRVRGPQDAVCWYEVKPRFVTEDPKVSAFARALARAGALPDNTPDEKEPRVGVLSGDPIDMEVPEIACPLCGFLSPPDGPSDSAYLYSMEGYLYRCYPCHMRPPIIEGDLFCKGAFGSKARHHKGCVFIPEVEAKHLRRNLKEAAVLARSARFERGEAPKPSHASAVS